MSHLPTVSGGDVVKALGKLGYEVARQRGSHIRLRHEGMKSITVPDHKVLSRGLLRKILRDAEISPDDFFESRSASLRLPVNRYHSPRFL